MPHQNKNNTSSFILLTIVVLSVLGSIYEGVVYWYDLLPSGNLLFLLQIVLIVLLVLWVEVDSKDRSNIYRPFEYGYLVLIFWLPYLPFYLWRTRKFAGVAMFFGFIVLFYFGIIIQWLIYLLSS